MNFDQSPEFKKDLKRLSKKWRSLPKDLEAAKVLLADVYTDAEQHKLFKQKFFNGKRAAILHKNETVEVVKMRLDVESIGRNDKVRVIFVALKSVDSIDFVELYAKNEKNREDFLRFKQYL